MTMLPVDSDWIAAIGYDPATLTIHVELKKGGRYHVGGASQADFDNFAASESKGRHFNNHIKPAFQVRKAR